MPEDTPPPKQPPVLGPPALIPHPPPTLRITMPETGIRGNYLTVHADTNLPGYPFLLEIQAADLQGQRRRSTGQTDAAGQGEASIMIPADRPAGTSYIVLVIFRDRNQAGIAIAESRTLTTLAG